MKTKIIEAVAVVLLIFTSCTQIAENSADLIRMNSWKNNFKNGTAVMLTFDDGDCATLSFSSKDKSASAAIEGLCIIDKKTLMISDKSTGENFVFSYKVSGNKLKLKNESGAISLKIVEKSRK